MQDAALCYMRDYRQEVVSGGLGVNRSEYHTSNIYENILQKQAGEKWHILGNQNSDANGKR